ncbi:PREDICTED: myosin-binding protein 3 [Tarenaya hassleriana]|uniref:myosin-binding protein 3 n=1 Tax=Tarenaya hassleriana TaxID=28532 RepID=UPI00053C8CFA|nr:PREDICTED: myosin-binding protein 3 [Tarenaya hassleriana]XP_010527233.1 PREDICTED: myosin-binding protein 3 [Tarenaya hassleriana]XP_019056970.1 PREDICTED: myosin-binding protein 3 [Tarenaya hassleriana]
MIVIEREMGPRECNKWAFSGLVVAFLELAIAYSLLCGSAVVFLASKFLLAFGLDMPCPCSGILGYKSKEMCLHRLLFEWPLRKIYMIQKLANDRLPSGIDWHQEQEILASSVVSSDGKNGNHVLRIGYQKGSTSVSGLRIKSSGDRESDPDVRTRQSMNQKQRVTGTRRRVKPSLFFFRGNNAQVTRGCADDTGVMKIKINEGSGLVDNVNVNVRAGETDETREDSLSVKDMKKLERALREESSAQAAMAMELEKERAAAATAADEAMAMILKLQADKASLEMEAKQYERMMEEKFAYDEEEMTILKEILVRREKENHFLEMELEAYKQMDDDYPFEHCRETSQDDLGPAEKVLSFHDDKEEKEADTKSHENGSLPEKEPIIYDVHVVEENTEIPEGKTEKVEEEYVNEGCAKSVDYKAKETDGEDFMGEMMNQIWEVVKDHDSVSSSPSSSMV